MDKGLEEKMKLEATYIKKHGTHIVTYLSVFTDSLQELCKVVRHEIYYCDGELQGIYNSIWAFDVDMPKALVDKIFDMWQTSDTIYVSSEPPNPISGTATDESMYDEFYNLPNSIREFRAGQIEFKRQKNMGDLQYYCEIEPIEYGSRDYKTAKGHYGGQLEMSG